MFTAPLMTEQARDNIVAGQLRVHPVDDADPDNHWLDQARKPGTDEYAEVEYLKQFLPPRNAASTTKGGRRTFVACANRHPR